MDIQKLVGSVIAQSMTTLGGESVTINNVEVKAVIDQENRESEIYGGTRIQRELTVEFPTDSTLSIKEGETAHARGKEWNIGEPVRIGKSMTNLTLIEPNRKPE